MLLFPLPADLSGASGGQAVRAVRTCDIFYTYCLQRLWGPLIIQVLMIISTLRVGPSGPLFLFWETLWASPGGAYLILVELRT
jgi:hypothetical protein